MKISHMHQQEDNKRTEALLRAVHEHAAMAASASKRAKTPSDRIAHAEIEALLRDVASQLKEEVEA